jgi:UDPglucose--hexose-1-phosphate uridylyltransferase
MYFCDIINQERTTKTRVISENEDFIALAPFAPRSPFETIIFPKKHESSYMPDGKVNLLAQILQRTLKQIDKVLDMPPYNMMIHTSPFKIEANEFYHWYIEILPNLQRLQALMGFRFTLIRPLRKRLQSL